MAINDDFKGRPGDGCVPSADGLGDCVGPGPCMHRRGPRPLLSTPSVVRLEALAKRAELELRRQLLCESDTAIAMLKLQCAAEAAVVVFGREHARSFEAEAAWEAAGARMVTELEEGERILHATHGHLLAHALAELRLRTAN